MVWGALSSGALIWGGLAGCQNDGNATSGNTGGTTSKGSATSTSTSTGPSSSTGAGGQVVTCDGMDAKVTDINDGTLGPNVKIKLAGVVAMSQKFLVTKSSSDGCIWGVFVSAPGAETAPYTGVLVESYGNKATIPDGGTKSFCPRLGQDPTGDAIPDAVKPGDTLDMFGETKNFLLAQCAMQDGGTGASVGQNQLLVDTACTIMTTGNVTPPAPHVLTGADVAKLGDPNDAMFHAQWGGVKVRLQNVAPIVDMTGTITFDGFGNFLLSGSNVQVGDKLYYRGYQKNNPCHVAPIYTPDPAFKFNTLDAISMLDFCTWALEPNDKCNDLDPGSEDCAAADAGPLDCSGG